MIIANFNENLITNSILKNTRTLDPIILEPIILKGGYDYEDCCCDGSCSCGCGHNNIELNDKMTTVELDEMNTNISKYMRNNNNNIDDLSADNTIVHDLNNVVVDNLILEQPDINIPLIAFRMGVIFLICMFIEVCNAWETLGIKNKSRGNKENNVSRSKLLDAPVSWGLYFQDAASPSFEGIVDLHNRIMFYLVVILFGVSWVMLSVIANFNNSSNKLVYRHLNHGTLIELIWTVGPALVLVAIAFPSFKLLYLMDII